MPQSLSPSNRPRHVLSLDNVPTRMAKADVKNLDVANDADWRQLVSHALRRAVSVAGLSDKEAAAQVGVDAGEFAKWLGGERRPHVDRVLAAEQLRQPFLTELARLDTNVEIVTEIRWRTA